MAEEQLTKKERKALKKQEQEAHRKAEADARRAQKTKRLTIITISVVVIVGFLFWLVQNAPESPSFLDETPTEINEITAEDNVKGAPAGSAPVTIVEYSDFECPACALYYPLLKQVVEDFSDQVTFVYRHLPIRTIHPNAELAARYAEAAGLQGQFFPMHDLIFDNQQRWRGAATRVARNAFESYGEELGLDVERLREDATSDAVIAKIEAQRIDAVGAGAVATPTFFINGERVETGNNPQSYDDFVEIITGERPQPVVPSSVDTSALEGAMEDIDNNDAMEQ